MILQKNISMQNTPSFNHFGTLAPEGRVEDPEDKDDEEDVPAAILRAPNGTASTELLESGSVPEGPGLGVLSGFKLFSQPPFKKRSIGKCILHVFGNKTNIFIV